MAGIQSVIAFMTPWEFSPTVLICCAGTIVLYLRGLQRSRDAGIRFGFWRSAALLIGVISIYAFMQTYLDYLSQHMFWVHRLQHLVLHHIGPFLIALSAPYEILNQGCPAWLRNGLFIPLWRNPVTRTFYRVIQNPVIASVLFVGLIAFWLTPALHFTAMLSIERYDAMNWSMTIDGLLFWWLMVGPKKQTRPLGYGARIIMLWVVMLPQMMIGAYIALNKHVIYDVYSVCGRAWPISPMTDQQIGGLITWIPASMMSVIAMVVVLARWLRENKRPTDTPTGAVPASAEV